MQRVACAIAGWQLEFAASAIISRRTEAACFARAFSELPLRIRYTDLEAIAMDDFSKLQPSEHMLLWLADDPG